MLQKRRINFCAGNKRDIRLSDELGKALLQRTKRKSE
jgi:hypothetical protein